MEAEAGVLVRELDFSREEALRFVRKRQWDSEVQRLMDKYGYSWVRANFEAMRTPAYVRMSQDGMDGGSEVEMAHIMKMFGICREDAPLLSLELGVKVEHLVHNRGIPRNHAFKLVWEHAAQEGGELMQSIRNRQESERELMKVGNGKGESVMGRDLSSVDSHRPSAE